VTGSYISESREETCAGGKQAGCAPTPSLFRQGAGCARECFEELLCLSATLALLMY